jgi:putative flippase GtrA
LLQNRLPVMRHTITLRRYGFFLLIGMMNAVVDIAVLDGFIWLLPSKTPVALLVYNTIAVIAAITNSYFWNRRVTFRDMSTGSRREHLLFLLQAAINLCLNDVIVVAVSSYFVFSKSVPFFISSNAAKAFAMVASSAVSFLCMRFFVFQGARKTSHHKGHPLPPRETTELNDTPTIHED